MPNHLALPVQAPIDATVVNRAFWEQAADRALKTAVQNAMVFFVGVPVADINWKQALVAVVATVILSFLGSILSSRSAYFESFAIDLVQRAGRTFVATFLASLATLDQLNINDWKQAAVFGASATVLSVVTSWLSKDIGAPGTASMLAGADLIPVAQQAIVVGRPYIDEAIKQAQPFVDEVRKQAETYMNSLRKPAR